MSDLVDLVGHARPGVDIQFRAEISILGIDRDLWTQHTVERITMISSTILYPTVQTVFRSTTSQASPLPTPAIC